MIRNKVVMFCGENSSLPLETALALITHCSRGVSFEQSDQIRGFILSIHLSDLLEQHGMLQQARFAKDEDLNGVQELVRSLLENAPKKEAVFKMTSEERLTFESLIEALQKINGILTKDFHFRRATLKTG